MDAMKKELREQAALSAAVDQRLSQVMAKLKANPYLLVALNESYIGGTRAFVHDVSEAPTEGQDLMRLVYGLGVARVLESLGDQIVEELAEQLPPTES